MNELQACWDASNGRISAYLQALYRDKKEPQTLLFDAMNYSLLAPGKRLRPFLVQLFCQACKAAPERALAAAAAVEMVHTYSLIHDDLPCMDDDALRRGRPTNHRVFGEATAVLAGDGLLTDAFCVLCELPQQTAVACVRVLSEAAGSVGMVGGQVLDMCAQERRCTEQEVLDIQSRKTGALICAACELGVLCADGTQAQREAAVRYGRALGLAFQIRDDVLDVEGDAAKLGKATGMDADKNTFVRLYGVSRCRELIAQQTELAKQALSVFDDAQLPAQLADLLANREA